MLALQWKATVSVALLGLSDNGLEDLCLPPTPWWSPGRADSPHTWCNPHHLRWARQIRRGPRRQCYAGSAVCHGSRSGSTGAGGADTPPRGTSRGSARTSGYRGWGWRRSSGRRIHRRGCGHIQTSSAGTRSSPRWNSTWDGPCGRGPNRSRTPPPARLWDETHV